jgi:microcystin-dependent protein
VPNGNYNIEFKIWNAASGGTLLWSEKWDTTTSQVSVVGGIFNVMLGSKNNFHEEFFADHLTTYLGIKVGTDFDMLPRQQITSVGYAFTAGNGVPKGGIIMWSGTLETIPEGWALCDGKEKTRSDGSKVTPPNLLDKFIVGAGNEYPVWNSGGDKFHFLTRQEMPSHTHIQQPHTHIQNPHRHDQARKRVQQGDQSEYVADDSTSDEWTTDNATATNQPWTAINNPEGEGLAHENRPPYFALAYIMKL